MKYIHATSHTPADQRPRHPRVFTCFNHFPGSDPIEGLSRTDSCQQVNESYTAQHDTATTVPSCSDRKSLFLSRFPYKIQPHPNFWSCHEPATFSVPFQYQTHSWLCRTLVSCKGPQSRAGIPREQVVNRMQHGALGPAEGKSNHLTLAPSLLFDTPMSFLLSLPKQLPFWTSFFYFEFILGSYITNFSRSLLPFSPLGRSGASPPFSLIRFIQPIQKRGDDMLPTYLTQRLCVADLQLPAVQAARFI